MPRLVPAVLALVLLAAAAPAQAAPKPTTIFLYHATEVHATGEFSLKITESETSRGELTGTTTIRNTTLPRTKWKGRRNAGFWGTNGWGSISAPFGPEAWDVKGFFEWQETDWGPEEYDGPPMQVTRRKDCSGVSRAHKDESRGVSYSFDRVGGRFVAKVTVPSVPGTLRCLEFPHDYFGRRGVLEAYTAPIDPAKMRRRSFTLPFEREWSGTSKEGSVGSVRWKGRVRFERGYKCRTPPDYPCHTMLM